MYFFLLFLRSNIQQRKDKFAVLNRIETRGTFETVMGVEWFLVFINKGSGVMTSRIGIWLNVLIVIEKSQKW